MSTLSDKPSPDVGELGRNGEIVERAPKNPKLWDRFLAKVSKQKQNKAGGVNPIISHKVATGWFSP